MSNSPPGRYASEALMRTSQQRKTSDVEMMYRKFAVLFALLSVPITAVPIIGDPADLPHITFDFIVVGGGTAGNVIANRLTENPRVSVLVIEAGVSNEGALDTMVPFLCTRASPDTPYDWNFTTTPQIGFLGRSIPYPRGHVLGGSSSINYMAYTRGSSEDWDRYARLSGDKGWSWNNIQPYIQKNEKWSPPADGHNTTGQFNPAFHSTTGINSVSLSGFPRSIDNRVIQTTQQLKDEFPFNLDMNSGNTLGVGWIQNMVGGGQRSSSATSYLGPSFIDRPNLHVLIGTRVTRLLVTKQQSGKPLITTVEFTQTRTGPRFRLTASKEVILSAGAVGTPHILLHSGIGDRQTLASLNIPSTVHIPEVGRNLSDHPLSVSTWLVNSTNTFDDASRNITLFDDELAEWNASHTGPLAATPIDHLVWSRLPKNSSIFTKFRDPASGPNTPHIELLLLDGLLAANLPATGHFLSIVTAVVSPAARGNITLATNDPFDAPLINPNLLGTEFDLFTMREAVRSAKRFVSAPAWKDYIIAPVNGLEDTDTDEKLNAFLQGNSATVFHPFGTAAMSPVGASHGVVDPTLLMKGVSGLRVVDASILPFVPAAHPTFHVYIVGERASDLIKAAWKL